MLLLQLIMHNNVNNATMDSSTPLRAIFRDIENYQMVASLNLTFDINVSSILEYVVCSV